MEFESTIFQPAPEDSNYRELRNLLHGKQNKLYITEGIPIEEDGKEGDLILASTDDGVRLCIKAAGQWFRFKPEEEE